MDSTTLQVIQLDTSTEQKYYSTVTTLIQPITFTVTDIFSFTSLTTLTSFPTGPTFSTTTSTSIDVLSSTVQATTIVLSAVLFTFTANTTVTVFDRPVSTIVNTNTTTTVFRPVSLYESTTTVITAFTYSITGYAATSTVGMSGTFFEFIYPEGTLSVVTTTFGTGLFSTVLASASTTLYNSLTITEPMTQLIATTTRTIDFTPTQTEFTTPPGPVPFRLPFFPQ